MANERKTITHAQAAQKAAAELRLESICVPAWSSAITQDVVAGKISSAAARKQIKAYIQNNLVSK